MCPAHPKRAPGPQNTAYSRQIMSKITVPAAPAIDPMKNSSLFEVPFTLSGWILLACYSWVFISQSADGLRELRQSLLADCLTA